jgi:hypothetical protein
MDHLLEALLLPQSESRHAWMRWRSRVDINTLSYVDQLLLAALNPSLSEWLKDDPAAGILQGIVRRSWSQNQLRLREGAGLASMLQQGGVSAAVAGPMAWSMKVPPPAIRVITHLTFLIPREQFPRAVELLIKSGWKPFTDLPGEQAMDAWDHVGFHCEDLYLNLHWRLLQVPMEDAVECERALQSSLSHIEWNHRTWRIVSPEASLLHLLCSQRDNDLPWQADLALAGTEGIHWPRFLKLARRFAPSAIGPLQEWRPYSRQAIPPMTAHSSSRLRAKVRYFWNAYRSDSYFRRQKPGWSGFPRFLAGRWNLQHVWEVPFAGAKRVFQLRRPHAGETSR